MYTNGNLYVLSGQPPTSTGTIVAVDETVISTCDGCTEAFIQVSGSYGAASVTFDLSYDLGATWLGTNFTTLTDNGAAQEIAASQVGSKELNDNGTYLFRVDCGAATHVQIRATDFTMGTIDVLCRPNAIVGRQCAVTISGNPVLVAGSDGTNTQTLAADTAGNLSVSLNDFAVVVRGALLTALNRQFAIDPATGRLRVQIVSGNNTLDSVSTVSAVTSLNQLNSLPIRDVQITPIERTLWGQNVRSRIT
jgi:hypothetical protein